MTRSIRSIAALVLAVAASLALPALAQAPEQPGASPYFKTLYKSVPEGAFESAEAWEAGLRDRLKAIMAEYPDAENEAGVRDILALVDAPRLALGPEDALVGNWQVRSLQADGLGAYTYPYFPARIYVEGQALVFDKASGSQRHRGMMARASAEAMFFAGALYYAYQSPRLHSAMMAPEADVDPDQDELAMLYRLGEDHYLMAFAPRNERYRFYEMRKTPN